MLTKWSQLIFECKVIIDQSDEALLQIQKEQENFPIKMQELKDQMNGCQGVLKNEEHLKKSSELRARFNNVKSLGLKEARNIFDFFYRDWMKFESEVKQTSTSSEWSGYLTGLYQNLPTFTSLYNALPSMEQVTSYLMSPFSNAGFKAEPSLRVVENDATSSEKTKPSTDDTIPNEGPTRSDGNIFEEKAIKARHDGTQRIQEKFNLLKEEYNKHIAGDKVATMSFPQEKLNDMEKMTVRIFEAQGGSRWYDLVFKFYEDFNQAEQLLQDFREQQTKKISSITKKIQDIYLLMETLKANKKNYREDYFALLQRLDDIPTSPISMKSESIAWLEKEVDAFVGKVHQAVEMEKKPRAMRWFQSSSRSPASSSSVAAPIGPTDQLKSEKEFERLPTAAEVLGMNK